MLPQYFEHHFNATQFFTAESYLEMISRVQKILSKEEFKITKMRNGAEFTAAIDSLKFKVRTFQAQISGEPAYCIDLTLKEGDKVDLFGVFSMIKEDLINQNSTYVL